jgi:hypothetical protein
VTPVNAFLLWSRKDAPHVDKGPFPPLTTISQYVDVMDYVRRLVAIDYIGIGSDFTIGNPQPRYRTSSFPIIHVSSRDDLLYGIDYVQNFNRVSDLPVLRAELIRHGYSSVDIAKITKRGRDCCVNRRLKRKRPRCESARCRPNCDALAAVSICDGQSKHSPLARTERQRRAGEG